MLAKPRKVQMTILVFQSLRIHIKADWSNGNFTVDFSRSKVAEVFNQLGADVLAW